MAAYEIKSKRHHAVVRRQGYKQVSQSFDSKTEVKSGRKVLLKGDFS